MEKFEKKTLHEKRKMNIEELIKYYTEYRIHCYNKGDKLKGINLRKKSTFYVMQYLKSIKLSLKKKTL